MRQIWNDFFHLFFPRLCVVCKEALVKDEEEICLRCLIDLPHTGFLERADNPVDGLFAGVCIDRAAALLHYEKGGKVQRLVHSFKYHGNKQLAYQLGRQAALALQAQPDWSFDWLIPVPLHPKRQRERGYNQSEWICRGLASILHTGIHTTALQRRIKTQTQTQKSLYERRQNMQEAFTAVDADALRGRHVLLVDDVVTSGATLSACAEALLTIPGIRIRILALAVAT
jgi:ComF family protein